MSRKKEITSVGQVVSAIDPDVASQAVTDRCSVIHGVPRHPDIEEPQAVVQKVRIDLDGLVQEFFGDQNGVAEALLGAPNALQQLQVVDPDDVIQEVLDGPEVGPQPEAVAVPEEHDLSLEVLVFMATVVFVYMATAISYPFENLSFKCRFGVWAVVFVGLRLPLIIWWKRNNCDRNLLSRALRQIRGTGGF